MRYLIGCLCCFILCSVGAVTTPAKQTIMSKNQLPPLFITVGAQAKQFVVSLAANPTTGYQWTLLTFDAGLLKLSSSNYQRPNTNRVGAGGKMLFTFTIKSGQNHKESTPLIFKYARPWEPKGGTLQTVIVYFHK